MKSFVLAVLLLPLAAPATRAQDLLKQFPVRSGTPRDAPRTPRAKRAPQISLAKKGAFPTVKASDAALKGALAATNLAGARKLIGKRATFVGTVVKAYTPRSNSVVLLNFAADYKTALVGAVTSRHFAQFPNLSGLVGKRVLLSGKVVSFRGQTQVDLDVPGAIRVVR